MEVATMYQILTKPTSYHFGQYSPLKAYQDPRKEMMEKKRLQQSGKNRQKKFKVTSKHKPSFIDEKVKPFKGNPSPNKYNLQKNILKNYKSAPNFNKIDKNLMRKSYLYDIDFIKKKFNPPGVGSYNLIQPFKTQRILKLKFGQKQCFMSDVQYLSQKSPGPGFYNPELLEKKLKINMTDHKFYQKKHDKQQAAFRKVQQAKVSPATYEPIPFDSFSSIQKNKKKSKSRWSHGTIDIRTGRSSLEKFPSPAQYSLINQWQKISGKNVSPIGKLKMFSTFTKSQNMSVYH